MAENVAGEIGGDLLTKKYAGLPFGVWLIITGGVVYLVRRNTSAARTTSSTALTNTDPNIVTPILGSPGVVYGGTGANVGAAIGGTTAATPETITQWLTRAVQIAVENNFGSFEATTALRAYANGGAITDPRQIQIINAVVPIAGVAPGLASASVDNTTVTPPNILNSPSINILYYARNTVTGGIYAVYADGHLSHVTGPDEWIQINGGLDAAGAFKNPVDVRQLPSGDPLFANVA